MKEHFLTLAIIGLVLGLGHCDVCTEPQKTFYMSYDAISNNDYLGKLFDQVDSFLPTFNMEYEDTNGSTYVIRNLKPNLYYNEHSQKEEYNDRFIVNVTMGQLYLAYKFNYEARHEEGNKTGFARGRVLVDHMHFTKRVFINLGVLEWDPIDSTNISLSSQLALDYEEPAFNQAETSVFIQMLNDHVGTEQIKGKILSKVNEVYRTNLKSHLNREALMANSTIHYSYSTLYNLNFTHVVKDFQMSNTKTKGLEVFMLFGLEGVEQECTKLPTQFDEGTYGGLQEIYSLSTVRSIVLGAIHKGLFNASLTYSWDVPEFQFYMGDLGNFVKKANDYPAYSRLNVRCHLAEGKTDELKVTRYDEHDIYVQAPEECFLLINSNEVLKVSMDINIVARLVAENNFLNVVVVNTGIYGIKFESIDPEWKVTDEYIAKSVMGKVLNQLIGRNTFGSNWRTFNRKYPVSRVLEDYIVIYDASEK